MDLVKSTTRALLKEVVKSIIQVVTLGYVPRSSAYDYAEFTPITISNTETISFWVQGITSSSTIQYVLGSDVGAYVYIRGSDGRTRIVDNNGNTRTTTFGSFYQDGKPHFIEIRINPAFVDFYRDGVFYSRSTGVTTDFTFNIVGALQKGGSSANIANIYGVTISNQSSWPMQSTDPSTFEVVDLINGNDLVYSGAPNPITPTDTIGVPEIGGQ